jgi:hypothetical protein
MATNLRSTVVGVFGNRASAEQAVQALEDTGFGHDQIWYSSPGGASSFFEDIKSLFTGTGTVSDNLVKELTDMGLSDEEARYYANEYRSGHSVVAVRALDREQEAMALLQMFGAFHYNVVGVYKDSATSSPAEATLEEQSMSGYVPHDADSVPEAVSTPPMESTMEPASTTLTPQESAHEAHEAAPAIDEPVHPIEEDYRQGAQADVTTEQAEDYVLQESPPVPVTTEPVDYEAPSLLEIQPNTTPLEPALEDGPQATQPIAATKEPVDHETRMQEMQRQIQEVQRQLEEAQAQLQATKEREAQLRTAIERENQFKDAQKRLQDLQDELRATLDELRRTEESVAQLGE